MAAVCVLAGEQPVRVDAAFEDGLDGVAGRVDRRLVAGVEQQDGGRHDLVVAELLAVDLGGDHMRQQILPRLPAPLGDDAARDSP